MKNIPSVGLLVGLAALFAGQALAAESRQEHDVRFRAAPAGESLINKTQVLAGSVTGIVIDTVGTTVHGAVRVADAVGTIVAGTIEDAARNLAEVPRGLLDYATSLIGTPYKWGGTDADRGLDCSGFVLDVVKKSSSPVELPRTARDMSRQGEKVEKGELLPGDLVFFNTRRRPFSHVGIYLGDDAFVHAASGRKSGKQVRIDKMSSRYYTRRYNGARRLAELKLD